MKGDVKNTILDNEVVLPTDRLTTALHAAWSALEAQIHYSTHGGRDLERDAEASYREAFKLLDALDPEVKEKVLSRRPKGSGAIGCQHPHVR